MANVKFTGLPSGGAVSSADINAVVQGGVSVQITEGARATYLQGALLSLTGLTGAISSPTTITMAATGVIQSSTSLGNTLTLKVYNPTLTSYVNALTLTAGNPPTIDLNTTATIGSAYIYRVGGTDVGIADGGTGASTFTAGYVKSPGGTTALTTSATIPNTDITGLGTMSTQNANAVAITGGTLSGLTSLSSAVATLTNTTNQLVLGTTNTVTISSLAPSASRTYTLPDFGASAYIPLSTSGNNCFFTTTGATNVTLPTSGTLCTTVGSTSITTLGTVTTGTWNATAINGQYINYNTTNLKVSTNQLNTIQDLATTSSPTFSSLTVPTISGDNSNPFNLQTGTSNGNTININIYDVDNTTYRTFITGTAGNTPNLAIVAPAGGSGTIDNIAIGNTTAAAGSFTTLSASTSLSMITSAASTDAVIKSQVGNLTSSNAYMLYNKSTVAGWAVGINTANSNAFEWHYNGAGSPTLSSTKLFQIGTTGVLLLSDGTNTTTITPSSTDININNNMVSLKHTISINNSSTSFGPGIYCNQQGTGDAAVTFDLNGATSFTFGIDNSDSDKFKISKSTGLGVNDYFVISTAGAIQFPVGYGAGILTSDASGNITVSTDLGVSSTVYSASGQSLKLASNGSTNSGIIISTSQAIRFPTYTAGTLTSDASGNITAVSDERLKTEITHFNVGLNEINALSSSESTIKYKWNELSGLEQENYYAGFSAQKVKEVLPEAVFDSEGYLSLQDRPIIAALVNAVSELSKKINELESR